MKISKNCFYLFSLGIFSNQIAMEVPAKKTDFPDIKFIADLTQLTKDTFGIEVDPTAESFMPPKGKLISFDQLTENKKQNWLNKVADLFKKPSDVEIINNLSQKIFVAIASLNPDLYKGLDKSKLISDSNDFLIEIEKSVKQSKINIGLLRIFNQIIEKIRWELATTIKNTPSQSTKESPVKPIEEQRAEYIKTLKDDIYKNAVVKFNLKDSKISQYVLLAAKLKDWNNYLKQIKELVDSSNNYNLICLVADSDKKCLLKGSTVPQTTIFDLNQYIELKLKELKDLESISSYQLRGNFNDFIIGAQQFIDNINQAINSVKTDKSYPLINYSKEVLTHLLNIYKKVIEQTKSYYEAKLKIKKQVYSKAEIISRIDLAYNRAFKAFDIKKWNILDNKTRQAASQWDVALREVKTFVDDSGTKDLLCFVAITTAENRVCASGKASIVKYDGNEQPLSIFYLNNLIIAYILPIYLSYNNVTKSFDKTKLDELGNKYVMNVNKFNVTTKGWIDNIRKDIKSISTWQQSTKDAQAVLLHVVDKLEDLFNSILRLNI